jgi:protein involved in polysaccharide export with SLBB domain
MNSEVTVRGDGHISLPVVGDIVAENKTTVALQTELTRLYTDHVSNASLVVIVKESQSNVYEHNGIVRPAPDPGLMELSVNVTKTVPLLVYVGGEVPAPGIQPFIANTSALQAIYTAGGPTPTADMRSVVILRRGKDDTAVRVVINLNADLAGERTDNMMLQPFDVVIVPRSTIALFGDTLDQYVYRTLRPVANSSVGFFFTKQVGTFNQDTHTIP